MLKSDDIFASFADDDLDAAVETRDDSSKLQPNIFDNAIAARQFMTAGNATVTLVSKKTEARFTYRMSAATDRETGKRANNGTFFVALLNGPDNESSYKYMGRVSRDIYFHGRKSPKPGDISRDAPSALAFQWAWRALLRNDIPEQLEIWHEGRCGRCGRKLTVPASIASGFGPECITKVGG
jgi:Family of unknown function (DUF6011)